LLENIQNNKKLDFYKIINIIFVIAIISGLILPWFFLSNYNSSDKRTTVVSLTSIEGSFSTKHP